MYAFPYMFMYKFSVFNSMSLGIDQQLFLVGTQYKVIYIQYIFNVEILLLMALNSTQKMPQMQFFSKCFIKKNVSFMENR